MPDYYHAPALILTALLLPAFGYLYLRYRDTRTLLWFLGFLFALFSMALLYSTYGNSMLGHAFPWLAAAGQTSMQVGFALFLGSLSQSRVPFGRVQVLYAVLYAFLLVVYSVLWFGVFRGVQPSGWTSLVFPATAAIALAVCLSWCDAEHALPLWMGVPACTLLGGAAIWACLDLGPGRALTIADCANLLMTAVLLVFVFRRFSPGVFLSVLGFLAWSLACLYAFPAASRQPALGLTLIRFLVMGKVVAAVGMLVLALEDELESNKIAQLRERRARLELEAYANLNLTRRRVEDFDRQGTEICETVVAQSRFSRAALLLESGGRYRLAGYAGFEPSIAKSLREVARRIAVAGFLAPGSAPPAAGHSKTVRLDLTPWLVAGDDPERLRFTPVLAVPMIGRAGVDGAVLLSGLRSEDGLVSGARTDAPRADDLLPIEMLATRVQATRSQTMLFEKLIDSEKYASLGQLAGNVTQQLNSPLTVILGYGSLLADSAILDAHDRKAALSIMSEARRIRSTLESLSRVSRDQADQPAAVSVSELLADMEQLYRSEFLQRAIDFQVNLAPRLPRIRCGAQQLRQAVLHCLQYAIGAVERQPPGADPLEPKTIRLEAAREGNLVQISVSHSGEGFLHPERAFDPFVPARADGETAGMGLSLCATILREQNGRACAVNLDPRGAAIILELQAA